MNWVTQNWVELCEAVLAVVGAANLIVKLTPTPKDDAILAKVISALKVIGLNKESK